MSKYLRWYRADFRQAELTRNRHRFNLLNAKFLPSPEPLTVKFRIPNDRIGETGPILARNHPENGRIATVNLISSSTHVKRLWRLERFCEAFGIPMNPFFQHRLKYLVLHRVGELKMLVTFG